LLGFILFIARGSSPSVPEIVSLAHSPKSYLIYIRSNTCFVSHSLFSRVSLFYCPSLFLSVDIFLLTKFEGLLLLNSVYYTIFLSFIISFLKIKYTLDIYLWRSYLYVQMRKNTSVKLIILMFLFVKEYFLCFPSIWPHWVFILHFVIDITQLKKLRLWVVHCQWLHWYLFRL
jgi:hypothetical protein